jgi:hypothetical protein
MPRQARSISLDTSPVPLETPALRLSCLRIPLPLDKPDLYPPSVVAMEEAMFLLRAKRHQGVVHNNKCSTQ